MRQRPYLAALEAAATEINPFLVVIAIGLGVLNFALYAHQLRHSQAAHATATEQAAYVSLLQGALAGGGDGLRPRQCLPALAPELREMLDHD